MNRIPKLFGAVTLASVPGLITYSYADSFFSKRKDSTAGEIVPIVCRDGSVVIPWKAPTRNTQVSRLKEERCFDVLIIGGGATGSGCALDASVRGLNVALVEQSDFAAGTSSRSTKLIHGGVRYLEAAFLRFDYRMFALVNEALQERSHMLQAIPYLNSPIPIMIPIYESWKIPYMWLGTKVYDFIAGRRRFVPPSHFINKSEALYRFPMLDEAGLKGAIVYYDGQMNDSRMNLMIAMTAAQNGAAIGNHTKVLHLLKTEEGKVCGARVLDEITEEEYDIKAKVVVNATGPFADAIRKMAEPEISEIIKPAGGVHVVLPDHFCPDNMGLIVPKTKDGRVLFFLPWEGGTLSGTTDHIADISMTPEPTDEEIDFILEESNRYLNRTITRGDVKAAWCGLRPLVLDPNAPPGDTKSISREHVVEVLDSSGLITIAGGKWTTYRQMAEDAIDTAVKMGKFEVPACSTCNMQLLGADRVGVICGHKFDRVAVTLRNDYNMSKDLSAHLTHNYGTRALQIAEITKANPSLRRPIHNKHVFIAAEVIFAVKQEYALSIEDVVARRMRLAFVDSRAAAESLPTVARIMADLLGWDKIQTQQEIDKAVKFLKTMHCGDGKELEGLAKNSNHKK